MQSKTAKAMVKIHGLSFSEGQGVGRSESGKVYFVDYACPEDLVEIEVYKDSKKFGFGRVANLIESSELRTSPRCSVFGKCGGCSLQHVNYEVQVDQKQKVLEKYLSKNSGFTLEPFESCDQPYNYRTRIEVHVENNRWGFYKKKSKSLVFPENCHLVTEEIQKHLSQLNQTDGHWHVDSSGIKPRSRGSEGIFEQINKNIDQKIKTYLLDIISESLTTKNITKIFDLYAGTGNYSLALAPYLQQVPFVAVELSQALIQKGKSRASLSLKIDWICSDVVTYLKKTKANEFQQSLIVVNPPRDGLDLNFKDELLKLEPELLIYVSCNPMTLFRDIDALSPKYRLESLKGFDMFPQTMHFETVALLSPT
jgi:23S rRNA (uracil1939-C5)-methyltransferase